MDGLSPPRAGLVHSLNGEGLRLCVEREVVTAAAASVTAVAVVAAVAVTRISAETAVASAKTGVVGVRTHY